MSLTKDDPNVTSVKSLVTTYDMPVFAVDMIKSAYKTTNPFVVSKRLKELFEIDNLSIEDISLLIHQRTADEANRFSICSSAIFK